MGNWGVAVPFFAICSSLIITYTPAYSCRYTEVQLLQYNITSLQLIALLFIVLIRFLFTFIILEAAVCVAVHLSYTEVLCKMFFIPFISKWAN